jgi:FkbM family methyltransferase
MNSFVLDINSTSYNLIGDESIDVYKNQLGDLSLYKCIDYKNVIDIGANIGMTTLYFAEEASHVFSFEPDPKTFNYLLDNLEKNKIDNVSAFNVGIGKSKSKSIIVRPPDNPSSNFVKSGLVNLHSEYLEEHITLISLDRFVRNQSLRDIDLIKIDVEGLELAVLAGGGRTLRKNRPTVILEMNSFCLNVLNCIPLPIFVKRLRSIFPFLLAIDDRNFLDLHSDNDAFHVMYENSVNSRYRTILGCFDDAKLVRLRGEYDYGV